MPQYGVIVYSPPPADPREFTPEHVDELDLYPVQVEELGGKVLGASFFTPRRGFAFEPVATGMAVRGDTVTEGTLHDTGLVISAFYVVQAPDLETAVRIAAANPAVRDGGAEVRELFVGM